MNENKALYVERIIILLFIGTIGSIFVTVIGALSILLGVFLASILGVVYVAFFGWYASMKVENKELKEHGSHIRRLMIRHFVVLLITLLTFDTVTKALILVVAFIGMRVISSTFHNIEESERDHIHFRIKTIIMPHTRPLIIWLMTIASIFIYGNTLKTNPNGIILDETFITNQVQAWSPVLQEVAPGLNPNGSVGNYVSRQIAEQQLNPNPTNQNELVQREVDNLSSRYGIPLTPDTPLVQALATYINMFLEPWMSGPIWGVIVSFAIFLTFLPFVGAYQMGIKACISFIHKKAVENNILNLYLKNLNKERFRL